MISAYAKIMNKIAKPNSKTQQLKREKLEKRPIQKVVCKNCGNGKTTLYKVGQDYYCKECKVKIVKESK
jgi:predicted SprT family Zn-dependent metalloprotease